jgi:hypothetical protein
VIAEDLSATLGVLAAWDGSGRGLIASRDLLTGAPPLSRSDRTGLASTTGRLVVKGYLFAHDFPDAVDEMRAQAGAHGTTLGMSYEMTQVEVPNQAASIWTATAFTFTGAAVLRRDRAAYPQTWIEVATSN